MKIYEEVSTNNSAYECGKIINCLLKALAESKKFPKEYRRSIMQVAYKYFQFLCKVIINSHVWKNPLKPKIKL